jgi:uncharacterized protein YrzB (UPF0473 family)
MNEERDDVIILQDDEGNELQFEHLDTVEMNGTEYFILLPIDGAESADEESTEVVILKVAEENEGEYTFASVDDEEEADAVFEEFTRRVEEYDEDEEE